MGDTSTKKLAVIFALIDRYAHLPRHGNKTIQKKLAFVREMQIESVESIYAKGHETSDVEILKNYYLENLHSGQNLDKVVSDGGFALGIASRLDDTYDLLVNALEFGITAQELDDALAIGMPDKKIKTAEIKTHIGSAKQLKARLRHADLLRPIGPGLAPYASSRLLTLHSSLP